MLASRVRMATFKDSLFTPGDYVLATDDDFSGTSNGSFRYIGTDEYVMIPDTIKEVPVTSYTSMFRGNSVIKGVASKNTNIINMSYMFYQSTATELDLSNFDTSNVTNMSSMFRNSSATTIDLSNFDTSSVTRMDHMFYYNAATELDLSNFDTSSVINMSYMFYYSAATIGYARTQADADRFNASSDKPAGLNFVLK